MRVDSNDRIIPFDVDETLVVTPSDRTKHLPVIQIYDPYLKKKIKRHIHWPNVRLLINYSMRGTTTIVWSKNGKAWANEVVKALKLQSYIDYVFTKPFAYVDDQSSDRWMGDHVYLQLDDTFGKDMK